VVEGWPEVVEVVVVGWFVRAIGAHQHQLVESVPRCAFLDFSSNTPVSLTFFDFVFRQVGKLVQLTAENLLWTVSNGSICLLF